MKQAGTKGVFLHGCVGPCQKKVWGPEDVSDTCEICGTRRYDSAGKPKQFIVHFPLAEHITKLLELPQYANALRWEGNRSRTNARYITG